jgi:hypothetical protein
VHLILILLFKINKFETYHFIKLLNNNIALKITKIRHIQVKRFSKDINIKDKLLNINNL